MKLTRVQVPDFRVLKNIDIEFEKEFFPSIFPLGSQNGGGKSTLLQLIFTLLHCAGVPERKEYLQNLLQGFQVPEDATERELASLYIWDGTQEVKLKFLATHDNYLENFLEVHEKYNPVSIRLSLFNYLTENKTKIRNTEKRIDEIKKAINKLEVYEEIENQALKRRQLKELTNDLIQSEVINYDLDLITLEGARDVYSVLELNLNNLYKQQSNILDRLIENQRYLRERKLIYICSYLSHITPKKENFLLCKIEGVDIDEANKFLNKVSDEIFLAAPISQIFLFTSQESKKMLLQQSNHNSYYLNLNIAKSKLPGLFTYDFVPVDSLIQAFKSARDQDFREAIETEGGYGNNYKNLLNDLNLLLGDKKVNISTDFSKVTFKPTRDNIDIELNPEDLSHGEMKRLSIYMWVKYGNIPKGSIVLMDEIEIALHPDWQYQIVLDLQEWGSSNQYILATHSYELCQSLVPAQVKEIEPKLIKSEGNH